MPATVTVTGKVGPGNTLTAAVFSNVSEFAFDCQKNMLTFQQDAVVKQVDIGAATTITLTKSSSTYVLTIV